MSHVYRGRRRRRRRRRRPHVAAFGVDDRLHKPLDTVDLAITVSQSAVYLGFGFWRVIG